jgi:hypothetical protein
MFLLVDPHTIFESLTPAGIEGFKHYVFVSLPSVA